MSIDEIETPPTSANPAVAGLGGFALTTFVLGMHNTGSSLDPIRVGLAFFFYGDIDKDLGWFLFSFAIFNTYMLFWSARINVSVFLVFLILELTEIVLFFGFFNSGNKGTIHLGGYLGILTALVAWYASAAVVASSMRFKPILPVGKAPWS